MAILAASEFCPPNRAKCHKTSVVRALQRSFERMRCIHPASPNALTLSDGRVLTLVEPIGRGSLGEVHRGVLESTWGVRRPVAVKVLAALPEDDRGELLRRLAQTARRAACIRHPSVVQTLEIDRTDGDVGAHSFVVMELVCGESLASLLHSWRERTLRVPVDFALVVALKMAEGLGAALYSENADGALTSLVHGDLSPRQVLVSDQGEVKIGDFGQGDLRDIVSHVRSRYGIAYTAPEVASGLESDARSDVFSVGVILREMLVGPRFAPKTPVEDVVKMVCEGRFHASVLEPNLPRDLKTVVDRALDPDPMQRYPHARALAFDLRREMLRMGLSDAQTCVRHAVVGWCEVRGTTEVPVVTKSDIVPRSTSEDTSPEIRRAKVR
ncbi:MAG: serine/threonine protein kinase [Labilithrix sp.]|nr:serine/threonine protein kinase [Labilithrix sp.]